MFREVFDNLASMKKALALMWVVFVLVSLLGSIWFGMYGGEFKKEMEVRVQEVFEELGENIVFEKDQPDQAGQEGQDSEQGSSIREGLMSGDLVISPLALFRNNLKAALVATGLGLIPFLYLPVISLLVNLVLVPLIMGMTSGGDLLMVIKLFFLGILPHGILELTALLISIIMGIRICKAINWKIRGKTGGMTLTETLVLSIKTLVLVVLPALFIAAFIEVYISGYLVASFL